MQDNDWYADTAYDSRKKKDVPPPDPAGWSKIAQRNLRAHVLPLGVHCGEYRYRIWKDAVNALKDERDDGMATHEQLSVPSFANPLVKVAPAKPGGYLKAIIVKRTKRLMLILTGLYCSDIFFKFIDLNS